MKLLLDTNILLWSAEGVLSKQATSYVLDASNTLYFSPASIWEIVTKYNLKRKDFTTNPEEMYDGLLKNGYVELTLTARHMLGVGALPNIHKDPFDRILVSQAIAEGARLLTSDAILAKYSDSVIYVPKA